MKNRFLSILSRKRSWLAITAIATAVIAVASVFGGTKKDTGNSNGVPAQQDTKCQELQGGANIKAGGDIDLSCNKTTIKNTTYE